MTDQLNIEAMNNVAMIASPATVVSWNAKTSPPEASGVESGGKGIAGALHTKTRWHAGKFVARAFVAAAVFGAGPTHAAEGPVYDVFAKALAPITAAVFGGAPGQPGAMVVEGTISQASGKAAAARDAKLRLAIQAPDRLRADLAHRGAVLTASRSGRELWAAPPAPMRQLAAAAGLDLQATAADTDPAPLIPLGLDPQMLVFLPVVFDVQDLGTEDIDGTPHRNLEFGFLPELRRAIRAEDFTVRAWIDPDHRPRRLTITGRDYSLDITIDDIKFADQLPEAAWQPAENQEVLHLPASALHELFEQMLGQKIEIPSGLREELPSAR
jgi:hypothetical protein